MTLAETLRAPEERGFWILAVWLLAIFLMGGGARDDISSLVVLRPLAACMLALAIYRLSWIDTAGYRALLVWFGAVILLVAVHLVPLPPSLWHSLPQRDLIAEIDQAAGLGDIWRPLSIAPERTWNALFSLMIPLSVLLLGIRLDDRQIARMVPVVLAIGALSVVLGTLQVAGGARAFNLYAIHNVGAANGLFANRNHQAAFLACLPPLLAVFATARGLTPEQRRLRTVLAGMAGVLLVPVLLVTGSRGGLVLGLLSFAASVLVYRRADAVPARPAKGKKKPYLAILLDKRVTYGGFAVAAIIVTIGTISLARAEAVRRLLASTEIEELRVASFGPVTRLVGDYFPFGSGAGTFVEAFFRAEPRSFLSPTYFNHAHFDYLEWAVTGGVPAMLLVAIAAGIVLWVAVSRFLRERVRDPGVALGRAGVIVIALFAVGSVFDYHLRTPSIAALAALAAVWACRAAQATKNSRDSG